MGILTIIGIGALLAFLITAFICAVRVEKIATPYIQQGVFGKMSAYIAFDLTAVGVVATIGGIALLFAGKEIENYVLYALLTMALGIFLLFIGIIIYRHALKKCPEGLKDRCIRSMMATGLGVAVKPALLFVKFSMENAGSSSGGGAGFARSYDSRADGQEYVLQEVVNGQGVLRSPSGRIVHVNRNSDGTVYDSAGTLYDPVE